MYLEIIKTLITAATGGGVVGLIEFLIRRRDERQDKQSEVLRAIKAVDEKVNSLEKKIDAVDAKNEERETVQARVRILRFSDELQEGRRHSKDSFDQCMSDITLYEKYCKHHEDFKNNQTARTVEYIKRNYDERMEKRDWL